jgi:hypothetical protein
MTDEVRRYLRKAEHALEVAEEPLKRTGTFHILIVYP